MKRHDNRILVKYACFSSNSFGRMYNEINKEGLRTSFQRDRDRILHSAAFRRLKHKTQVFLDESGDYYRTRLTHTLEVSQIARSLAFALNVNEDLTEAIALAHDLGHPPFGHAGEEILNYKMKDFGGFDHNEQCLRILTYLEKRYFGFNGLNLSWETLEGIVKHNGIIKKPNSFITDLDSKFDFKLSINTSIEGQIASIADDVAYMTHDFDDGLNYGLFNLEEIKQLPIVGEKIDEIIKVDPNIEKNILAHEMIRRVVSVLIEDILKETRKRIQYHSPENVDQIRNYKNLLVGFSEKFRSDIKILRKFLNKKMWRHPKFEKLRKLSQEIVSTLFEKLISNSGHLKDLCLENNLIFQDNMDNEEHSRLVADNLSFLTDRNAKIQYNKCLKMIDGN